MIEFSWPGGLRDGVLVADNVLDADICLRAVSVLKEIIDTHGHQGRTAGGVNTTFKRSTDIRLVEETLSQIEDADTRTLLDKFVDSLQQSINICYSEYRRNMRALWHLSGMYDSGFQVQRYSRVNDYYREHVDSFPWGGDLSLRALSVVVYLNDVPEGGETEFPLQDLKVKPVAGRICVFPSNFTHPHSGNPAFSWDKWIVSTFLHGVVDEQNHKDHEHSHSHQHEVADINNEHYHICVQCANRESHECKYEDHHH